MPDMQLLMVLIGSWKKHKDKFYKEIVLLFTMEEVNENKLWKIYKKIEKIRETSSDKPFKKNDWFDTAHKASMARDFGEFSTYDDNNNL